MSAAPRSASSSSSRDTLNSAPQLDQREDAALQCADPFSGTGHLVDPPQFGGGVPPSVRPRQVHQLARGQVGHESALGFVLDLRPRALGDGSELPVQVVHHSFPFRLPIPSEPVETGAGPPAVSVSASTSVTGSVVNK